MRWRSRSPCCRCTSRRTSPSSTPASRPCIWRKRREIPGAGREPGRTGHRLPPVPAPGRAGRHERSLRLPRPRGAGIRRESGGRICRRGAADDLAQRQGAGIPAGAAGRRRRRDVPQPAIHRGVGPAGGGAAPLLCRHDPRHGEALHLLCREPPHLQYREMFHKPSRFIREMPAECLEEIRLRTQVSRPTQYVSARTRCSRVSTPAASSSASGCSIRNLAKA